jgi:hypothetical protein
MRRGRFGTRGERGREGGARTSISGSWMISPVIRSLAGCGGLGVLDLYRLETDVTGSACWVKRLERARGRSVLLRNDMLGD